MKNIKNERGFTLIELLAVIVVLAIVLLMGAMAVIPRMNDARRQAFALEANRAIQGAQTYLVNNNLKGNTKDDIKKLPVSAEKTECVTIKELIDEGILDFDPNYEGRVLIKRKNASSDVYLYQITMTNGTLQVIRQGVKNNQNVDVTYNIVQDYDSKAFTDVVGSTYCNVSEKDFNTSE